MTSREISQDLSGAEARRLLEAARAASGQAYVPYSDFPVGAALLTVDGRIITGVNVENASFGLTLCAERVALSRAVSEGYRAFQAMAVYAARRPNGAVTPCGACRQFMAELMPGDAPVVMTDEGGVLTVRTVQVLLPMGFDFTRTDSSTPGDARPPA